jgi:4-diphosphocytidyl-2-C-methyl-D-erythritol kinase
MYSEKAYAKVNLHLQVNNKREDGFHNILSLMSEVSIYDLLKLKRIEQSDSPGCHIVNDGGLYGFLTEEIPVESNLIYKAALLYMEKAGLTYEVDFHIEKNIPAGGGLGGGSSDAAAVLRLLNGHFNKLSQEMLLECAQDLGSDIPYSVNGGFTIAQGRGEMLETIGGNLSGYVLLVFPGIHVNTALAFQGLNRTVEAQEDVSLVEKRKEELRQAVKGNDLEFLSQICYNDFEGSVFTHYPLLKEGFDIIADTGSVMARMSGSGSTLYGLYATESKAEEAKKILESHFTTVVSATFVSR